MDAWVLENVYRCLFPTDQPLRANARAARLRTGSEPLYGAMGDRPLSEHRNFDSPSTADDFARSTGEAHYLVYVGPAGEALAVPERELLRPGTAAAWLRQPGDGEPEPVVLAVDGNAPQITDAVGVTDWLRSQAGALRKSPQPELTPWQYGVRFGELFGSIGDLTPAELEINPNIDIFFVLTHSDPYLNPKLIYLDGNEHAAVVLPNGSVDTAESEYFFDETFEYAERKLTELVGTPAAGHTLHLIVPSADGDCIAYTETEPGKGTFTFSSSEPVSVPAPALSGFTNRQIAQTALWVLSRPERVGVDGRSLTPRANTPTPHIEMNPFGETGARALSACSAADTAAVERRRADAWRDDDPLNGPAAGPRPH